MYTEGQSTGHGWLRAKLENLGRALFRPTTTPPPGWENSGTVIIMGQTYKSKKTESKQLKSGPTHWPTQHMFLSEVMEVHRKHRKKV